MNTIAELVKTATKIMIIQADNPDGDSLASALALEHIFGDIGKAVSLYCGVDIPAYLQYMSGWDRVSKDIPNDFDLSVIVDTSAISLLEQLQGNFNFGRVKNTPCIVIDHHHLGEADIPFASIVHMTEVASTGEAIYELATVNNWPMNIEAKGFIAQSVLSDTLGMMTDSVSPRTLHIMAELVEGGVSLPTIDGARKELMKKSPDILHYKGRLLQRVEFGLEGRLASITIPWDEIHEYSQSYNPSMLVLDEMRFVTGVQVTIAYKLYKDGKVTGKIRCNRTAPIAQKLAEHFGGGGHAYAAGFKIEDGTSYADIKSKAETIVHSLLE